MKPYSYHFSQRAYSFIGIMLVAIGATPIAVILFAIAFKVEHADVNMDMAIVGAVGAFLLFFLAALPLFAFAAILERLTDIANEVALSRRQEPQSLGRGGSTAAERREPTMTRGSDEPS